MMFEHLFFINLNCFLKIIFIKIIIYLYHVFVISWWPCPSLCFLAFTHKNLDLASLLKWLGDKTITYNQILKTLLYIVKRIYDKGTLTVFKFIDIKESYESTSKSN